MTTAEATDRGKHERIQLYTKKDLREAAVRSTGARHQMVLPEGKPMRTRATETTKGHNTTTKKALELT